MVKVVLKSKPNEKLLVNNWAFRGIAINEDKSINPIIIWADGSAEELLRFWPNETPSNPIEKKPFERRK